LPAGRGRKPFLKATGDGLSFPLADFSVTTNPRSRSRNRRPGTRETPKPANSWSLADLCVVDGYRSTLAVENALPPLHTYTYICTSASPVCVLLEISSILAVAWCDLNHNQSITIGDPVTTDCSSHDKLNKRFTRYPPTETLPVLGGDCSFSLKMDQDDLSSGDAGGLPSERGRTSHRRPSRGTPDAPALTLARNGFRTSS